MSDIETAVESYAARRSLHEIFTDKLQTLLRELLDQKAIPIHFVEARTKTVESFRSKCLRSSKAYVNPVEEIIDLSGLRVVAFYQDDLSRIGELIRAEFRVDADNSVTHVPSPSEFGYRSDHYVVTINDVRGPLVEWSRFRSLKAEIQVRTVLQHAWAAISHKLQYKRENDVPEELRRKLFRLSALFELSDDEFVSLRKLSAEIEKNIDHELVAGGDNVGVNYLSISKFLEKSVVVTKLVEIAAQTGFTVVDDDDDVYEDGSDPISDLVAVCLKAGIANTKDLEVALIRSKTWAKAYLASQFAQQEGEKRWVVSPSFVCQLLLLVEFKQSFDLEDLLALGWSEDIADRVLSVANEFLE